MTSLGLTAVCLFTLHSCAISTQVAMSGVGSIYTNIHSDAKRLMRKADAIANMGDATRADSIIPIESICKQFHVDSMGCVRVKTYLGKTLRDLKEPLKLKHKVHQRYTDYVGDITTRESVEHPNLDYGADRGVNEDNVMHMFVQTLVRFPQIAKSTQPLILAGSDFAYRTPWKHPTLVRDSPVPETGGNHVVVKVFRDRYMEPIRNLAANDIPFDEKADVLVWRGSTTGHMNPCTNGQWANNSRALLVHKYSGTTDGRIDVGFAGDLVRLDHSQPDSWRKGSKGMTELLKNKFIMVVEGNDVASSTEWVLASSSVPVMVPPTVQTWGLHGWLEAWKHYIPVKSDFSDVPSQLDWAISNPDKAAQIANEGKVFMKEFQNKDREERIHAAVLAAYFNRFVIEDSAENEELYDLSSPGVWRNRECPYPMNLPGHIFGAVVA